MLYLTNIFFKLVPETRCFSLKALLLRLSGINLGKNVRVCSSVTILGSGRLSIGDDTWIGHQTLISTSSQIIIGKYVDIAPRVYIGTGTHEIDNFGKRSAGAGINKDIIIQDGVWLGANCILLPGVTIGEKSVVAAGALVTKDIPARVIVAGVPARIIRSI